MKTHSCYRMWMTPLSPIHVGTGDSYEPTNYVIEDEVLHEFDTGAVLEALALSDRALLLEIGNRQPDSSLIQAVQRFFFERRAVFMAHAMQRIPVLPGVARLYANRVGQTANREANGAQVINRLEIDRTSFNPVTRLPVLFGSSLKGAMRTALLDAENGGNPAPERKGLHEFQGRLFNYLNQKGKPVLELDPLRLVQLADAAWNGETGLPAAQVYLAVNRKKAPVKDSSGNLRKAAADNLYQILECVPGLHYRAFSGQLNVQSVAGVPERDRQDKRQLPAAALRFDAVRIAQACNDFYLPIFEAECQLLAQRSYLDAAWHAAVQQLLAASATKMQRGEAFLLRVGRHSGAESVTLNGVRTIKILQGKEAKPEQRDAAKTWWLAANTQDQATGLLPFGWLLVETCPVDADFSAWLELQVACEPHLSQARALATRLHTQQAAFAEVRRTAAAKRAAEAEAARQAAAAKRAAEAEAARQAAAAAEAAERKRREKLEREERLQQMTPNLQVVEKFKTEFEKRAEQLKGKKENPNTVYHDKAKKLAKDAASPDWMPDEKRAAADAIAEWLPKVVQVDVKDERKKLKLAALRGE